MVKIKEGVKILASKIAQDKVKVIDRPRIMFYADCSKYETVSGIISGLEYKGLIKKSEDTYITYLHKNFTNSKLEDQISGGVESATV